MSSDTADSDRRSPDADALGDEPRVLLFMEPGRNRELLAATLGEEYRVAVTTDVETLDTDFDCCLFDCSQFNRVAGTVQSKRDTSKAVFLPFVLLVGEGVDDAPAVEAREYVDDVIRLPVKKAALLSRVGNLVERRRTAVELAKREAQLERTVEDLKLKERAMDEAPVGITITDPDREDNPMVYINERFQALTGYDDAIGKNCRLLQGERTDPETRAAIRAAIDEGRPVSTDILNYRKDGRTFWNKLDIAPVRGEDGAVANWVGFQTDITERKIRERRLEVLNRVLSHNLRNKMNVIEGHVSLLRDADGDRPASLDAIESTAGELMGLADAIRDIDGALSATAAGPIDLAERLEQLVSAVEDRFPDATIELDCGGGCRVDVPGLVPAIEEAVENAVKHNDTANPTVELEVECGPDWVEIEIEDDGPGIPDRERTVLESGETPLDHADRLGLWFIHWVVARVGGRFSIAEADPRGTVLTLSVPRSGRDR